MGVEGPETCSSFSRSLCAVLPEGVASTNDRSTVANCMGPTGLSRTCTDGSAETKCRSDVTHKALWEAYWVSVDAGADSSTMRMSPSSGRPGRMETCQRSSCFRRSFRSS